MKQRQQKRRSSEPFRRFTPKERAAILADAKRNRLTGAQVAAKYGISAITYYIWRQRAGATWYAVGRRGPAGLKGARRKSVPRATRDRIARVISEVAAIEIAGAFSPFGLSKSSRGAR